MLAGDAAAQPSYRRPKAPNEAFPRPEAKLEMFLVQREFKNELDHSPPSCRAISINCGLSCENVALSAKKRPVSWLMKPRMTVEICI
jgi:hypothetical protein